MHNDAPGALDVPAAQAVHDDALDRPVCVLYVPAAQLVHALDRPVCVLYVPAAQAVHDDAPDGLYVPAGQTSVHDVAREQPAALCRPAGQSAQALHWSPYFEQHFDRPVSYCPAPHPLAPKNEQPFPEHFP